ncbi:MAG: hypothetical protein RLZZ292_2341 [Bacteroidota bacterium]
MKQDTSIAPINVTSVEEDNASINRYQTAIKSLEKWRWVCAGVILLIVLMGISLNNAQIFQALIPASMWWVVNSYIRNLEGKIYDIEHPYVESEETPESSESRNNNQPADPLAITSFALSLGFITSLLLAAALEGDLAILILLTLIPAVVTAISATSRTRNEQFRKRYSVAKSRRLARAALLITLVPIAILLLLLLIALASFG